MQTLETSVVTETESFGQSEFKDRIDISSDDLDSNDEGTNPLKSEDALSSSTGRDSTGNIWLRVENIILNNDDKDILLSKDLWLNDKIINAAQILLKKQFPEIPGFQDTLLQKKHKFSIMNGEFIQIINKDNNHWITVSRIGLNQPAIMKIYDSMRSYDYGIKMKELFASLIHAKEPSILLAIENIQQQQDSCNCGLFAIAFATAESFGHSLKRFNFDVQKMRTHLISCLEKGMMSPFPGEVKIQPSPLNIIATYRIYCSCRMPYDAASGEPMLQCNLCDERFHQRCEKNHAVQWVGINENNWYCAKCMPIIDKGEFTVNSI